MAQARVILSLHKYNGAWPSGKAPVFGTGIRGFESLRPSHIEQSPGEIDSNPF